MPNIDKQALLRAAVKIGAHMWEAEGSHVFSVTNGTADAFILEVFGDETSGQQDCDIASFIAAANPATVLAMLDDLQTAEKRIAELTEFVQHVNKCLLKNDEYSPLSHELIQSILGIRADGKGAAMLQGKADGI